MKARLLPAILAVTFVAALSPPALAATTYTVVDLGVLPGHVSSFGWAVNSAGNVVGFSDQPMPPPTSEPMLWNGSLVGLGTLGGTTGCAMGINDSGEIVGWAADLSGQGHAFRYVGGAMYDLGTLGGSFSCAYDVNASGSIVGESYDGSGRNRAFLWTSSSGMQSIGTLGGNDSWARGVDSAGNVVGASYTATYGLHAFYYDASASSMSDVGTLGGQNSYGEDLNDSGLLVGGAQDSYSAYHAYMWNAATSAMTDLGHFGGNYSWACDINESGAVVGESADFFGYHAFLWTAADGMLDLNTLIDPADGWALSIATAVNDAGYIVAVGTSGSSLYEHAVLLVPAEQSVPLPGALLLGMAGLGLVAVSRKTRRLG